MSLFSKYYEEFLKYDKDVLVNALESVCEELDSSGGRYPSIQDIHETMRRALNRSYESRSEWDLDEDDCDR